jgi:16S rRNA (adenine1518-N6/adenine1519-N6)-dimethyltransferase
MAKRSDNGKPFAKKSFGQNFLTDANIVGKIVAALELSGDETVVEIGAGRGALTEKLIEKAGKAIAIEFDRDLVPVLTERFRDADNFQLIEADALTVDLCSLSADRKNKLAANLPYNISTQILQRLMRQRECFSVLVLMFQREVVERITAAPATKDRGFLSVLSQLYFDIERLFDVPPGAFKPQPKVWSSVIRLRPKTVDIRDEEAFRVLISTAFTHKRKTIENNLKALYPSIDKALLSADIEPGRRAETLTLDEWIRLFEKL